MEVSLTLPNAGNERIIRVDRLPAETRDLKLWAYFFSFFKRLSAQKNVLLPFTLKILLEVKNLAL
jgi:hypothetical protein